MGTKAKKAKKKDLKRANAKLSVSSNKTEDADFLPLEGGPVRKLPEQKLLENTATVLYVGRIPHGFYEKEMEGYFGQFGTIKRLGIARNKRTGKSKHFGFLEFDSPEVYLIPPVHVHPKLGLNHRYKPLDSVQIERERHEKERTLEEHKKLVEKILKRDKKRQKRIEAASIDYECPEILSFLLVCLFPDAVAALFLRNRKSTC